MIYFFVIVILIFLSFRYDICGKTRGRYECYLAVLVAFILIAGLRWRVGGDTTRYLGTFYKYTPVLWDLSWDNLAIGSKPLWKILLSLIYTVGGKFYWVQIIESAFVNILVFSYIRKHCQSIFTCVFFYFISDYFIMNMEIMKAAFCIVIGIFANDYFLERKWIKAYSLVVIAVLFHPQALLFALTPLFLRLKINKIGLIFLSLSFIVGYVINVTIGDYIDLLSNMGDDEINEKIAGYGDSGYVEERSIKWQIINAYPLILYSIVAAFLYKSNFPDKIMKLQPLLILGLAYQILSLPVYIFYRIAESYKIYLFIFLSYTIVSSIKESKYMQIQLAYIRTVLLCVPLIFSLLFNSTISKRRVKYYPYVSILNKRVIKERESYVHEEAMASFSIANKDQY